MEHGMRYQFRVRALNGAGNWSEWGYSLGFWVDTMINDTGPAMHDGIYSNSTAIVWSWPAVEDSPAGIEGYYISIGTSSGGSDILASIWTSNNKYTFTGGTNGATYFITTMAVDRAGNMANPVSNATGVTVDTVPPRVSAVEDRGTFSPSTNITFTWEGYPDVGSGIAFYYIAIGTTPYSEDVLVTTCDEPLFNLSGAEAGKTYYAKARAVDHAGNKGDWGVSSDGIAVDLTAPTNIVLIVPGGYANTTDHLDLEWTASEDPLSGIQYYLYALGTTSGMTDIVNWTQVVGTSVTINDLSLQNGNTYHLSVKAVNGAGIESMTYDEYVVIDTVDPGPPSIVYSPYSRTNAVLWTWTEAEDDLSGIHGYIVSVGIFQGAPNIVDGAFVEGGSFSYDFGIHEVSYYIEVIAVDNAGNIAVPTTSGAVTVDLVPPKIAVLTRDSAYSHTRNVTWSWEADDPVSGINGYEVTVLDQDTLPPSIVDGPVFVMNSTYTMTEGLVEGHSYIIKVTPQDKALNWGNIAYGDSITIDTVPPTAEVTINNEATMVNSRAVTVQISTTHRDVTQMLISNLPDLSDATWEPFSPSRVWYLSPGDGPKSVYVVVRDAADHQSSIYKVSVTLDTVQPKLSLDLPGDVVSTPTLTIKGKTEPGADVLVNGKAVKVEDDGTFEETVDLEEGTNLITVVAIDDAGNEVKVTRAINREAFHLPSWALMLIIVILLIITIVALAFGVRANNRLKTIKVEEGRPRRPSRERPREPKEPRIRKKAPREKKKERPVLKEEEDEGLYLETGSGVKRPDIISRIRATEDDEAAQLRAASAPDADEVTLETDEEDEWDEEVEEEEVDGELEVEEPPERPLAQVRCNECTHIIPIYSEERPLKIQCPSCGKLGMIRK
jgi:hypothetical protein